MALVRTLNGISKSVFSSSISKSWLSSRQLAKPGFLARSTSTTKPLCEKKEVKVTFVRASGERIEAKAKVGDSLLDVVVNNEIDLDGFGACEGTLTCSTCHLIFSQKDYDKLPEKPTDEELDMLDLAYDLSDTSRLGCQIIMTEDLDGLEVKVPTTINDARS
ncbi:adrenodoxin-like protein 2, mitochondrial [Nasonia vitripennis]|uniref:2Fe-2S ferredoxin-type domain-containing protein n=1 Tax=Nasonia vitripennis TaxID=7425 RepID=A0A7M7QEG2_NASVI|nr:adrenodoxin-like protein 2, mitochondrial [Nasonia vitripennis]